IGNRVRSIEIQSGNQRFVDRRERGFHAVDLATPLLASCAGPVRGGRMFTGCHPASVVRTFRFAPEPSGSPRDGLKVRATCVESGCSMWRMIRKRVSVLLPVVAAVLVISVGAQQPALSRVAPETLGLSSAHLNEATELLNR